MAGKRRQFHRRALPAGDSKGRAVAWHINCHSMGSNTGASIEGVDGCPRADFVLGDRDGTSCAPEFTAFVRDTLASQGYSAQVNDTFRGMELVRAQGHPARGRHSLQLEVNKRLYMDTATLRKHAGFERLQEHLTALLDGILAQFGAGPSATPRSQGMSS